MKADAPRYTLLQALVLTLVMCLPGAFLGALLGYFAEGWLGAALFGLAGSFLAFCIVDGAGVCPLPGDLLDTGTYHGGRGVHRATGSVD